MKCLVCYSIDSHIPFVLFLHFLLLPSFPTSCTPFPPFFPRSHYTGWKPVRAWEVVNNKKWTTSENESCATPVGGPFVARHLSPRLSPSPLCVSPLPVRFFLPALFFLLPFSASTFLCFTSAIAASWFLIRFFYSFLSDGQQRATFFELTYVDYVCICRNEFCKILSGDEPRFPAESCFLDGYVKSFWIFQYEF